MDAAIGRGYRQYCADIIMYYRGFTLKGIVLLIYKQILSECVTRKSRKPLLLIIIITYHYDYFFIMPTIDLSLDNTI